MNVVPVGIQGDCVMIVTGRVQQKMDSSSQHIMCVYMGKWVSGARVQCAVGLKAR